MNPHKYRLVNGCMEWTGPTLRAAQAARDEDLNRLFDDYGSDVPTVVVAAPCLAVVFQQFAGYFAYRIDYGRERGGWGSVCSGLWSRSEAEQRCRRHLAQTIYQHDGPTGLDVLSPLDVEGRAEHERWIRFQREYVKATAEGANAHEAHRLACERSYTRDAA